MKKHIPSALLILFMFLFVSTIKAQEVVMPDNQMQSALKGLDWKENATAFCYYNGELYMLVWNSENYLFEKNYYPFVYKYTNGEFQPFNVNNTNKLKFGYPTEDKFQYKDGIYNFIVYGKPLFFSYYGKMWYYSLNLVWEGNKRKYYEMWARYDDANGWKTWNVKHDDLPDQVNMGVCVVDSTLRFIANESSTHKFFAKDYQYNALTSQIDFRQSTALGITGDRLDGVLAYKDEFNNNCFIYNFFDSGSLIVFSYSPISGWHNLGLKGLNVIGMWSVTTNSPAGVSALLQGSVQGMKTSEPNDPAKSNRFNVFYVGAVKTSSNSYPLYNYEFIIPDNPYKDPLKYPYLFRWSSVVLPASAYPDLVSGEFCLQGATTMTPKAFGSDTAVKNGLAQQLMLFYPDSKKQFNGATFNSDFWQPVPKSSVTSIDLADDSLYGPQIRKLWTLVGIVDGAPPCSIDWPVWEEHHFTDEPTLFEFTVQNVTTTDVSSIYEDKYSLGGSIETGIEGLFSFETSFKYAHTYKSKVSSKHKCSSKISTNFGLNEHSQELGYYIWNIPQITRTSYQVFPWYDTKLEYPVTNSLQYQFRTQDVQTITENHEISRFPWLINHPNDPSLSDWKAGHRVDMHNDISGYGLAPLKTIGWTNPNSGQEFSFEETNTSTSTVETTSSYSWGIGTEVSIPEVFKIKANYDQDISYSTENTYETEFGTEVLVSLKPLTDKVYGINLSYYDMSIYWFKPNVADWWYLDSVSGQRPWYIAYVVGTTHQQIKQIAPDSGSNMNIYKSLFTWDTEEEGDIDNYTFYISTEPLAGPGSTVYTVACGKQKFASIKDFAAILGKTYYWSVKGVLPNSEIIWSKSRAFRVGDNEQEKSSALQAAIYPNPGTTSEILVSVESGETGPVEIILLDMSGVQRAKKEITHSGSLTLSSIFPGLNLSPGIYIAVIRSGGEQVVNKIMIR